MRQIAALLLGVMVLSACAEGMADLRPRASATLPAGMIMPDGTVLARPDDTVYSLAQRYKVPMSTLIAENNLQRPYILQPGQRVKIPAMADYVVQAGDTPTSLASRAQITAQEFAESNNLNEPIQLQPGDRVRVPASSAIVAEELPPLEGTARASGAQDFDITAPAPPVGTTPIDSEATLPTSMELTPLGPITTPVTTPNTVPTIDAPVASAVAPLAAGQFSWPLQGRVLNKFGRTAAGVNDGINIAAPRGTPVTTAAPGTVVHASGDVGGLGNLVLIRHENNMISAYGHLDRVLVDKDAVVGAGEVIGTVGETGGVKSPQLHFQLRQGETPVDPLQYLPAR